jgi:carbamoyltransferase
LGKVKTSQIPSLLFAEHHQSHAASAFFPSPYEKAAILCLDGVGEWATTTAWRGEENQMTPLWEIDFPHSLGLLYSAFTYYTGFKVNSGEYKLMGLAPYGEPKYVSLILDHLLDLKPDGAFRLNMEYFNYATGLTMTNRKFHQLFGGEPRQPESQVTQKEMDIARSIQEVTEEVVLRLAKTLHQETGLDHLCMAGGVALNCVANGRLLREGPFKEIFVQPAAGDAGGALGGALSVWYQHLQNQRTVDSGLDAMQGSYLGPEFSSEQIQSFLHEIGASFTQLDENELADRVAKILEEGNVVGWFRGRMEFGPRALGGRSILGDPRNLAMQSVMNLKIKFRESFRPFAPAVLYEEVADYFQHHQASPYMLFVAPVKDELRVSLSPQEEKLFGIEKLKTKRSQLPAITHVDYSARIQTVHPETNPKFYHLLKSFKKRTGCGVLVNTSFNVRGEPIVGSPEDAYRCFRRTEMDYLVLENFLLSKKDQPAIPQDSSWMKEFELD